MVLACAILPLGTPVRAQTLPDAQPRATPPSDRQLDAIRRQLLEQRRLREQEVRQAELASWEETVRKPPRSVERGTAAVCLVNDMDRLRAVWTFESLDAAGAIVTIVRVPLCLKGDQWLTLHAGRWRATLLFGTADGGRIGRLPARELRLASGRCYEMHLADKTENLLDDRLESRRSRRPIETESTNEAGVRFFQPHRPGEEAAPPRIRPVSRPAAESEPASEPTSEATPTPTPAFRGPRVVEEFTRH
jgi:hypothetical protein